MQVVPWLFPGAFPAHMGGVNTRAVWLQVMGAVQAVVALSFLANVAWTRLRLQLARWRAARAERAGVALPGGSVGAARVTQRGVAAV